MLTLDPTNEKTYKVRGVVFLCSLSDVHTQTIEALLQEVAALFPDPYLHLGGDEVNTRCWSEDLAIGDWLKKKGKGVHNLQVRYHALLSRGSLINSCRRSSRPGSARSLAG